MDEVVTIDPVGKRRVRLPSTKILVLIIGLILVGVLGYFFTQGTFLPKRESSLVIAGGSYRTSPLYVVTRKTSTPITITVDGMEKKVLDKVVLKDGSALYVLVESADPLSSNIYKVDAHGVVTQLTSTQTLKYNFSVDVSELRVAYEETTIKDNQQLSTPALGEVMQLDLVTRAVERIAGGVQPRYIHTGAILVGTKDGVLVFPPHTNNITKGTPLLSEKVYSLYDVNHEGTLLAAYNTKTAMIDVFNVTPTGTLSFVYSSKTEHQPGNLSFSDIEPMSIDSTPSPKGMVYTITRYGAHKSEWNITSEHGLAAERLLYVTK